MYIILIILSYFISLSQSFVCTNGKDPKTLSKKEILLEFSKGRCSPILLVPGLIATKLSIKIDCETFKEKNNKFFTDCGWTDCKKEIYEFWKTVPKTEYNLWFPEIGSPISIITTSKRENICWANFIKQEIDFTKPITENPIETKGYKITVYGNTENTKEKWECGNGAIKNILNLPFGVQTKETKGFNKIIEKLESMGYYAGLTYQSLPFNFLKSFTNPQFTINFNNNLNRLFNLTKKKVVLLSHSFGNLNVYHQITKNLDQVEKDKKIKTWLSLNPPFLGSLKVHKNLLGGDNSLMLIPHLVGLHYRASVIANNDLGTFELLSKDPYTMYKNEIWFKDIFKRTIYEQGEADYENSGFDFLPRIEEKCGPEHYEWKDCKMGLFDVSKEFTVQIMKKNYTLSQDYEMFTKYNLTDNTTAFYNLTHNEDFFKFENPGVSATFVILRTLKTFKQYIFDFNITDVTSKENFAVPEIKYGQGDGTVPSYSQIIPPLKWAKEFKNEEKNSKPVKIIDYCSSYKEKYNIYDQMEDNKEYKMTQNEFFGIKCECFEDNTPDKCNHASIMQDSHVVEIISSTVVTNLKSWNDDYERFVKELDDNYLEMVTVECPDAKF